MRDVWKLARQRLTWQELIRWIVWAYARTMERRDKITPHDFRMWHGVSEALRIGGRDCDNAGTEVVAMIKRGDCEGPWRK